MTVYHEAPQARPSVPGADPNVGFAALDPRRGAILGRAAGWLARPRGGAGRRGAPGRRIDTSGVTRVRTWRAGAAGALLLFAVMAAAARPAGAQLPELAGQPITAIEFAGLRTLSEETLR